MLQQNQTAKPPISAKPKIAQKPTKYIIANKSENSSRHAKQPNDNEPLLKPESLPSSPPNFADDCCGILHSKHLECLPRPKNGKNGTHPNGTDESDFHGNHKAFKTPSFDSLSSSSGGFKDSDFVTKTRVAYEMFDRDGGSVACEIQMQPVGQSKVQEMKSRLFAQQQQHQQNHSSVEPSKVISRQQIQKSSLELEKMLGLRIENVNRQKANQDKLAKRLSKSFDDAEGNGIAAISNQIGANISKQIHQKLTEEMKKKSELIKEKFLIERMPVQQHYNDFTVTIGRSQSENVLQFLVSPVTIKVFLL